MNVPGRFWRNPLRRARLAIVSGAAVAWFLGSHLCAPASPAAGQAPETPSESRLRGDFRRPPDSAKPWAYWWWLDSAASREGITADFAAMKQQGISGVLLFDAGEGGPRAPKGPLFMSEPWRELFRHTLREADRFGISVGVNLCSGWDAGGTWVTPEYAAKKLVWAASIVEGPGARTMTLPQPPSLGGFYRDIAVAALPYDGPGTNLITNLELKAGRRYAESAFGHGLADLLEPDSPPAPALCRLDQVRLLDQHPDAQGRLDWTAPGGRWLLLRFGYTLLGSRTKCPSPGAEGYEIDFFNRDALDLHFANTAKLLVDDAQRAGARSLRYLHVDSYEAGNPSWSARFAEEFQARRGYDLRPWLPVLTGLVLESSEASHRFLWDLRRTIADLYAANYYGRLAELAHQAGLGVHPESSGPFWQHIDALQCAGRDDIPMTEFWKRKDEDRPWVWYLTGGEAFCDLVKQAASAAHIYGRPLCQAEAYTSMGPNWEEDPYALKDIGDRAFCAGLTRNVLCFYVHQSDPRAYPGYQWEAAGTHFDSHITWWKLAHGWFSYLARCQLLLRQGRSVADFCYFYGEDVPNFVPARSHESPPLPAGFDCDTVNAEVLLERLSASDGRLTLPDGVSYRYLVLPERQTLALSPVVLRKIRDLVQGGATVLGRAPQRAPGLTGWPQCDAVVAALARELWGEHPGPAGENRLGAGRVIWGRSTAEVAAADTLAPDVAFRKMTPATASRIDDMAAPLEWIHRRAGLMDIYFVANLSSQPVSAEAAFRAANRAPELWDAVTAEVRPAPEFSAEGEVTVVPMEFAPRQSFFVVFPPAGARRPPSHVAGNLAPSQTVATLDGPWEVAFEPRSGGPEKVVFEQLEDWTRRPEEGIRYYSGSATYSKRFDLSAAAVRHRDGLYLDLGKVKNLARVRLNGHDLGVVWTAPWRVDISRAAKARGNHLTVEVVNLWPNRLIGDAQLPPARRRTTTNVVKFSQPGSALLPSGLLGPVTVGVAANR